MPRRIPSFRRFLFELNLEIEELYRHCYRWYDDAEMSEFEVMVLILEDRRFLTHQGIDLWSVCRELVRAAMLRRHGGASTIEMQFIRTVNGRRERKITRKLREFLLAFLIQYHFDKRAILRSYLDQAFFGSGLKGAEAAAQKAFSKPIFQLSSEQCATLAAMLVYPMPLVQSDNWLSKVQRRAAYASKLRARFHESVNKIKSGEIIKVR